SLHESSSQIDPLQLVSALSWGTKFEHVAPARRSRRDSLPPDRQDIGSEHDHMTTERRHLELRDLIEPGTFRRFARQLERSRAPSDSELDSHVRPHRPAAGEPAGPRCTIAAPAHPVAPVDIVVAPATLEERE